MKKQDSSRSRRDPRKSRTEEILELPVTGIGRSGEGLAFSKGVTVAIPRAIPGDTVRARVRRSVRSHADAELLDVLVPSPDRVATRCAAFDLGCGGCQWLQARYSRQLEWKKKILTDALARRTGQDIPVGDVIGMPVPDKCRNKMSFLNRRGRLVFMQENSDRTIHLDRCLQVTETCRKVFESLRKIPLPESVLQVHIRGAEDGTAGVAFFVSRMSGEVNRAAARIMKEIRAVAGVGASGYRDYHLIAGRPDLIEKIGTMEYRIPHNGFFQTNVRQARILLDLVMGMVPANPDGNILDLYCGTGFFTLPAARKCRQALGIENNLEAVKSAAANAALNGIQNANFIAGDAAGVLSEIPPGEFRTVILDPPRSGCEDGVVKALIAARPGTVIYVSCFPESLARDLKEFISGPYRVLSCRPIDMFPQTYHVETVVHLERK